MVPSKPVRLTGTPIPSTGRLEVFRSGIWTAVRSNSIANITAVADVVCSELGYTQSLTDQFNTFADPTVNVEWESLSCSGTEASVLGCSYGGWTAGGDELGLACFNSTGRQHCARPQAAAWLADRASSSWGWINVLTEPPGQLTPCHPAETPRLSSAVRLVNGTDGAPHLGRVEVLYHGAWTPVCAENFGPQSAAVVCKQLGFIGDPAIQLPPDTLGGMPSGTELFMVISYWNNHYCAAAKKGLL